MSEFQDFLRYKSAYVAIGEFKPGKFEEAEQLYEQAISGFNQGFQKAYLLREPGTDKGIALIVWENREAMEENDTEEYKAILRKMAPLFVEPPIEGVYDLVSEISVADQSKINSHS